MVLAYLLSKSKEVFKTISIQNGLLILLNHGERQAIHFDKRKESLKP